MPSRTADGAMEAVNEIKEALSARSRTATLDELRSEGRKKVRLIRAEHIASMVSEAVHAAIKESGLIDPEEHERLVEKSRAEFKTIIEEREREALHAREVEGRLAKRERELDEQKHRFEQLASALSAARVELDQSNEGAEGLREELDETRRALAGLETEVGRAKAEAEQARADAERARADAAQARAEAEEGRPSSEAAPQQAGVPPEMLMSLFQELATLKAGMQQQATPAGGAADFSAALEKLTSSLNERLESFGKKMGISAAVEGDAPTDFSGLFKGVEQQLESNMDEVRIKQKAGGGIAANLARLKKLKGGG